MRREWRPGWACPAVRILRQQRRGAGDPTYRDDAGTVWRGVRTPAGPATIAVRPRPAEGLVEAQAWGAGAQWALDSLPGLLGADDDPGDFDPRLPELVEAWRRSPHWRFGRSGLVIQSLVPTIIEQRVTGQEAFAGYRRLVQRYGERAPGPGAERRLWVPPTPEEVLRVPSWEWLRMHIDPARSRALVRACRVADALERAGSRGPDALDRALRSIPGVGRWSSAEVRSVALGDPDAVSFGDYHVAKDVGWAVTGRPFDDGQLEGFLEPWRPQRNRAVGLIQYAAGHRPRRGARMAPRTHLPVT